MDSKQFEITAQNIQNIRINLEKFLNKYVCISEIVGTSKKQPKILKSYGKLISISKNIFSIEEKLGTNNKVVKSFQLSDILINKISIELFNIYE